MSPMTVATTPTAQRILAALGPALVDLGGDLLPAFIDALAAELDSTDLLLTPVTVARVVQPGTPLSDATRTPYPAWLAQVAGQVISPTTPVETARQQLLARRVDTRGTTTALIAAVKATLTGGKRVYLVERDGDPYVFSLVTYQPDTPDPAATYAAATDAKPVGLVMQYTNSPGQVYSQTTAEGLTYGQHTATGRTYMTRTVTLPA